MEKIGTLDSLMIAIPIIKDVLNIDMQVCLCDRERTIGVWYGDSFKMKINIGDRLNIDNPGDDMVLMAMETGKSSGGILPEYVYGVPVEGKLVPVFEEGKVVGLISCAISIKDKVLLEKAANNLNEDLISTGDNVFEILSAAKTLYEKVQNIYHYASEIEKIAMATSSIVAAIKSSARKSNILAINAAIEATRAGEAGRGFNIVSGEMGLLAKKNDESAKVIDTRLSEMIKKLNSISEELSGIVEISTLQVENVDIINTALIEIGDSAGKLAHAAKI